MNTFSLYAMAMRIAKIVKTPNKDEYCVRSEQNPDWSGGCYKSKEKAEDRLKTVEMFKHMKGKKKKGSDGSVDLPIGQLSPSANKEGIAINLYSPSGTLIAIQGGSGSDPKKSDIDCYLHDDNTNCTLTPLTELGKMFIDTYIEEHD
jgi:hypothetical protein